MARPRIVPLIENLPSTTPFVGPEALERRSRAPFRARIGANESVFGPSPKVIAAMCEAAAQSWMYGDPEQHDLKAALARHHGVGIGNIAVDSGVDALLGLVVRMTVEPGDPVVTSLGGYPTFIFHVDGHGGRLIRVPYRNDREDPQALLDAARRQQARLVYLANPDNPMGTWWSADDVQRMIDGVPEGTMLVLDEAYCDTAPADAIPPLDVTNPSVLRMRTFSKAYGMAGVRVGYCIGEQGVIGMFYKIRNHFDVSRMAQAGAIAALADQPYLEDVVRRIEHARGEIARIAQANQLLALPSATNFVAVDMRRDGAFARRVLEELGRRGVFVRMPGVAPLDRCVRISAGTPSDLALLEEVLPQALAAAAR
ncbi:MAG: pyridoxal phosphate-dependent aminotransferase [Hyphomicrobiaceae bacterium]